jgi:nucleotide-binding universal stress UspA family protein
MPPGPEVALPFGKMETDARSRLERLARQKVGRTARYEVEVMMGDPGIGILQVAKRLRANLIVMATHGRKGVRHLLLGSVAERVIREAPCPVLTVRPQETRATSLRTQTKRRKQT